MNERVDRVAVVVSANHGLIASLPFHCTLPLDFDMEQAATAAVVLIDVPGGSDADEVLGAFAHVAPEKIVLLGNQPGNLEVGRVLVRPVSVSEIGAALEAVADAVDGGQPEASALPTATSPSAQESATQDALTASPSDASTRPEFPPADHESRTDASRSAEDVQTPTAAPPAQGLDDARHAPSEGGGPLFGDVTPRLSTDGLPDSVAGAPQVEEPTTPDDGGEVPTAVARSTEEEFRWQLKRGTTAARDLTGVLVGYPALADPQTVIAEAAAEAAEGAGLDMLGLWRNDAGAFMPLGGYALRPSDIRRSITMEHPIVQEAWRSGGLVITRVADDPAVVAGLPGVYQAAMLLLPLATAAGHEVLVIGAGDGLDESRLQTVEDILQASASVIDFGIALDALLAALEL